MFSTFESFPLLRNACFANFFKANSVYRVVNGKVCAQQGQRTQIEIEGLFLKWTQLQDWLFETARMV